MVFASKNEFLYKLRYVSLKADVAIILPRNKRIISSASHSLHSKELLLQNSAYKRSPLGLKRHISPSFDVEENVGNLRTLMNVGKRQVSVANDVGRQMQMYNRLFDAGKKRAALSPSQELQNALELSSYLERAGRK
ncbi:unnamed protein product [Angiostrongylus costaricensis]|uniref:Uncharacterized protein n=1 Tax=Angiostrongylus costaricensis TaxID=334426 RepID=A0A0R3PVZ2_ANGCS|nr:unnamed protein product [Angiostrongylus costaricensis]